MSQLDGGTRNLLLFFVSARVSTALLDLVGVVFITAFTANAIVESAENEVMRPPVISWMTPQGVSPLVLLAIGVVCLSLRSFFSLLLTYNQARLLNEECSRKIEKFSQRIPEISKANLDHMSTQRLHFIATAGIRASVAGVLGPASTIVSEGAVLLLLLIFLVITSVAGSLASLMFLGISSVVLYRIVAIRQYRIGQLLGSATVRSISVLQESLYGYREFLTRGTNATHLNKFVKIENELSRHQTKQVLFSNIPRYSLEILVMCGLALLAIISSYGKDSTESFILITAFAAATARILPSLVPLQSAFSELQTNLGLSADLRSFDDFEHSLGPSSDTGGQLASSVSPPERMSVELIGVSYKYPRADDAVLSGVNLNLIGPSWISIQGPSGSGKSTLFDLIIGLRSPTQGQIRVSGLEPSTFIHSFPGLCSYLPQRITVVNASIAENVALGSESNQIDETKVEALLMMVGLGDVVQRDARGIWLPLGEMGQSISGGQLQRIGIARCLYTDPELLLLDESTTGLDLMTQREILKIIRRISEKILVISISHDPEISTWADRVYTIDEHRIEPMQ